MDWWRLLFHSASSSFYLCQFTSIVYNISQFSPIYLERVGIKKHDYSVQLTLLAWSEPSPYEMSQFLPLAQNMILPSFASCVGSEGDRLDRSNLPMKTCAGMRHIEELNMKRISLLSWPEEAISWISVSRKISSFYLQFLCSENLHSIRNRIIVIFFLDQEGDTSSCDWNRTCLSAKSMCERFTKKIHVGRSNKPGQAQ